MIWRVFTPENLQWLPPHYIYHLSLLVSAMHILLGDVIPSDDVNIAHESFIILFLNYMAKKDVLLICMLSFISLSLYITGDHYGATVALDLKV